MTVALYDIRTSYMLLYIFTNILLIINNSINTLLKLLIRVAATRIYPSVAIARLFLLEVLWTNIFFI